MEQLQNILQEQKAFSGLLKNIQQSKYSQIEFEMTFPVGKVLLLRTTILTIYLALKDSQYQYCSDSRLSTKDRTVLVKYARQAINQILRSHGRKKDLPPDDGKPYSSFHAHFPDNMIVQDCTNTSFAQQHGLLKASLALWRVWQTIVTHSSKKHLASGMILKRISQLILTPSETDGTLNTKISLIWN
jgi:hypothetical protein